GGLEGDRLGHRRETLYGHNLDAYARRIGAFGSSTICIDGHSFPRILGAYRTATTVSGRPVMIIAKTIKGKGISQLEDQEGWHGKALNEDEFKGALEELGEVDKSARGTIPKPEDREPDRPAPKKAKPLKYDRAKAVATRV